VGVEAVIQSIDADTIYDVPMLMQQERLDEVVLDKLGVEHKGNLDLNRWLNFLERHKNPSGDIQIALVGKYVELQDSYKSIVEAFTHAGAACGVKVNVKWVHSEQVQRDNVDSLFADSHGILVAPGFGSRGIDGKIEAIRHARENAVPFFGICLGMQCAVIEFARNVLGLEEAHSTEIKDYTPDPVIDLMEEQKGLADMGGTMRLGAYPCNVAEGSLAGAAYGHDMTEERHRHRYEFNDAYRQQFIDAGMIPTGTHPDSGLVEIVEIPGHPWFLGAQFHPEYKSTVVEPHPLFRGFIQAAVAYAGMTTDQAAQPNGAREQTQG
jgi:CTP synthase